MWKRVVSSHPAVRSGCVEGSARGHAGGYGRVLDRSRYEIDRYRAAPDSVRVRRPGQRQTRLSLGRIGETAFVERQGSVAVEAETIFPGASHPIAMRSVLLTFLLTLAATSLYAQTPVGRWKTIDDKTGKAKSIIEVAQRNGQLFGTVRELLNPSEPNPLCDECGGERHNQPILGMEILWDMRKDGDVWSGGRILDPENGKTYRCKIWLEEGKLRVRGYLGPFYRTQTWHPTGGD